jgi:hypothetical protein
MDRTHLAKTQMSKRKKKVDIRREEEKEKSLAALARTRSRTVTRSGTPPGVELGFLFCMVSGVAETFRCTMTLA